MQVWIHERTFTCQMCFGEGRTLFQSFCVLTCAKKDAKVSVIARFEVGLASLGIAVFSFHLRTAAPVENVVLAGLEGFYTQIAWGAHIQHGMAGAPSLPYLGP